jgi:hypothetical protein
MNFKLQFIISVFFAATVLLQAGIDPSDEILGVKCGTFLPENGKIAGDRGLAVITLDGRPSLQESQSSSSGRFLVHYDISGKNAVNLEDKNLNGVPDYIDSVCYYYEYVHNIEVNQLKYREPASDNGLGGSDAFDVYVMNIGQGDLNNAGLYGYTVPEIKLPGGIPSRIRYSAYIVIDNDYSERDSSYTNNGDKYATFRDTSYLGMKITVAHEYHHAVQFMYGEDVMAPSFNEMTSTWFEYRIFPETNDFLQYVEYLFQHPNSYTFGNGNAVTGYLYGIFGQYLHKYYGDSLLRRMWEIIATGVQSYDALNKALIEQNSTLENDWCRFMDWLYYTNERTKPDFGFDRADEFPLMSFYKVDNFYEPSYSSSGWLLSYEYRFYRVLLNRGSANTTPDIFDVVITNTDIRSAIYQSEHQMPYILKIVSESMQDYQSIGNTGYYYKIEQEKGNICERPHISEGIVTGSICYAFPNPFVLNRDETIYLPAPHDADYGSRVDVILLNNELNGVYEGSLQVVVRDNKRVVEFNPSVLNILGSGVYIFKVTSTGNECVGKIAIVTAN